MAEFEHEGLPPLPLRRNGNGNGGVPHRFGLGRAGGFFRDIEHKLDGMSMTQGVLLAVGGVLVLDWLVAPKGKSFLGQAIEKVAPGGPKLLPPPPPPAIAARGYYAGANLGAGFGHGYMPYGGWAHADPGGPTQYAHAAQRRAMGWAPGPGEGGVGMGGAGWYEWE
jgi:hypothetical protein